MISSFKPLVVAIALCGMAAPSLALAKDAPKTEAAASAIGSPSAGKAQIIFYRPSKLMGAAISFKVREGEAELGTLSVGKYFVSEVEPGVHTYTVHSEAKDELRIEVEAGETYYVQGGMTMGVALYRPNLSPSDKAAFDALSSKLKLAKN